MRKRQNISIPNRDFRKRFAQRDLEISRNEYEYLKDRYLESKSAQEENISDKAKEKPQTEQQQTYNFDVHIPSLKDTETEFKSTSDLYKKPEGKKKGAPEEKKERLFDIQLPTIQDLVDEYTKPYVYNDQSGKFEQIKDTQEQINKIREDIKNKPTPLGISRFEEAYMRATDPVRLLKDLKTKYNIEDEEDKEEQVSNAFDTLSDIMSAPMHLFGDNAGRKIKGWIDNTIQKNRDYLDDIISTWAVSKNDTEADTYIDAGIRLGEKQQYANAIAQYNDNLKNYIQLQQIYEQSQDVKQRNDLLLQMNNILAQNDKLRPIVEQAVTYNYDKSLGKTVTRSIFEFINNGLNNEIVNAILPPTAVLRAGTEKAIEKGLGNDVSRYGKELLDLTGSSKIKPGTPLPDSFMNDYVKISQNIDKFNKEFQEASTKQIAQDKEMALKNKQEAIEWAAWHTPSKEFKAKEKAAQDNLLLDAGTYTHGIWTVLGSSASFNGAQLLSTGLDWLGAGLLYAQHPAAKAAGVAAIVAGGGLGILSGVYENRAEVTQNYIQGLRDDLDKHGKLKKFLEEGKKQLEEQNIPVRDEQDVFRHFILKDYKSNDPVVRQLALRHMFGANNLFQNDMMAVSSDVAINAGINVFGPIGKVAEGMKILPEGSKFAFLRKAATNSAYKAAYNIYKNAGGNAIASAISPLMNIPYNVVKPVLKSAKSALTPMIKQMSRHMDNLASWAKVAPKAIFNVGTSKKYLFDFLGKTAVRGYSEAIEEGKQYEYGRKFSQGEFAGKSNTFLSTLMDDLSTGLYTGLAFVGHQFFGMQSDKELMSNMRGGFIGGVLNHGTAITAIQDITNARGEIKAGDLIFNNVMAEKLRQRSNIINGEEMAKYASRTGYVAMMNAFDRVQRIHDRISQDASEKVGLTSEELADQRTMFRRISALANNEEIINRAKSLGIKKNSSDFRKFVSLINTADQIQVENIQDYNNMVEMAEQILNEDGLSLNALGLFNQARQTATSQQELDAIELAEEWAKWAQPINNQILGQYAALNKLIDELKDREGYLTAAERRNLEHYIAQRERLDHIVAGIREQIGSTENMEFLNQGDPEVLTKYSQIYRTLYQASAQLENSSIVLNALYGKNNSADIANDFVKEQLDFINQKIDKENKNKSAAIKSSKKSKKNSEALRILDEYKQSVQDDQEFIAELAEMFDKNSYDANNRLDQQYQQQAEQEAEQEVQQEEQEESPEEEQKSTGAQNLPVSIYDKIPTEGKKFPIGSQIVTESDPGVTLTVQSVKVNPTTGQYLIEATDEKGEVRYIDDKDIENYDRALPAPYHYETVFDDPESWTKLRESSPLAQAYRKASIKNLPAIIDTQFRDELQEMLKQPLDWVLSDSKQGRTIMAISDLYMFGPRVRTEHPIYGAIVKTYDEKSVYIPSFRDYAKEMYEDFSRKKNARLEIVKKLQEFRDAGELQSIQQLLESNNISLAYMDVLDDIAALNSIARQIIDNRSAHMKQWLKNLAFYTESQRLKYTGISEKIAPNGELMFSNVPLASTTTSAIGDIVTVDDNGVMRVYMLAFPNKGWKEEDLDSLHGTQSNTARQYYEELANNLFREMNPSIQQKIGGIYVLPIVDNNILDPISLVVNTELAGTEGRAIQRQIVKDFYHQLEQEIQGFLNKPSIPIKQSIQPDGDGSQETIVQDIEDAVKELENVIANVNNGTLSFNGRIRRDARQYLDTNRGVLNKYRNTLRKMDQSDDVKSLIQRIEQAYQQTMQILSAFRENAVYDAQDIERSGDIVKNNMAIIPEQHALSSRSTSGIPVTATSDFIVNGKVELQYGVLTQTGEVQPVNYYTTYPGVGLYATFTYNGVKYKPVLVQPSHYKNGVQPFSEDGAQFITDVIRLQQQAEGLPIVAEAKRMIPNPIYKGTPKPVMEIPALRMTIDDIQELSGDSDSVGIANSSNSVQLLNRKDDKSSLWTFKSTQSGSIFLLHSFNFKEYQDGGVIPVKLIPAKLKKSDIDVIVSIIKTNALGASIDGRSSLNNRFELNGKETPFTNMQVLKMLIKIDTVRDYDSVFWFDNFGRLYHKSDSQPIDVITSEGEYKLRSILGNGYEISQDRDVLSANLGNQSDVLFGGLIKWITENGSLVISDNLVFDMDDVARNGKGFHGIGWSIKHGRLLSNMSGMYEPSISISLPRIDNNTTQQQVEEPASEEPKVHKKPKARYIPEEGGLLDGQFNAGIEFSTEEEIPETPLNEEEAKEDLKRMLGDTAVEFVDEILGILQGGLKILGYVMDNVIRISRLAGEGTQFHEAFHKIVELLFDETTRNRLYSAYSRIHKDVDPTNPRSISEGLAEDYKQYALDEKSDSLWHRYFARIKRFVKALFNKDRRLLYKTYKKAFRGDYSALKVSQENVERFNRIFAPEGETKGVLYHQIYDAQTGTRMDLENVPSAVDYRTAIDTIVDNLISDQGASVFGESVQKLQFTKEKIAELGLYKSILAKENPDDIDKIFIDIYNHWDNVLVDVAASFKRFGLHFKHNKNTNELETYKTNLSEKEEEAIENADEGQAKTADINQYELQDYEISKLNKMSERTKYFFATIPDVRFVEEDDEEEMYVPETNARGEEIDTLGRVIKTDPETGLKYVELEDGTIITQQNLQINMVRNIIPNLNDFGFRQFVPFYNTCNIALNHCYSADSLYELLDLFKELADEYPQFSIIAYRYASLLDNMNMRDKEGRYITTDGQRYSRMDNGLFRLSTKDGLGEEWFTADELEFAINYNVQSMAVSIFNNISGVRLNFKNIRSTRPSKDSVIFQVANTDNGYSSRRYMQHWHSLFITDIDKVVPVEVLKKGERIFEYVLKNKYLFATAAEDLKKIVDAYTDRRSEGWRTGEVQIQGRVIKINKNPEKVKAEYLRILSSVGIQVTREQFDHLLYKQFGKTDANALRKYFQQDGEDFGRSKGVSIKKLILAIQQGANDKGQLSRTVISGSFFNKVGAVIQLADAIWSYNQSQSELMQTAPGKNKYYAVANRNAQDLMIQDLNKPDGKMANDLMRVSYHAASIFLPRLLKGEIYLKSCTDAGYESDNKSDYGSDFMQMTNSEDAISKITLVLDNYIVPPTLSNKKTYQPIQVIDSKTERPIPLPGTQYVANRVNVQTDDSSKEVYSAINVPVLVDKTFGGKFITSSGKMTNFRVDRLEKHFVVSDDVYDTLINYAFSEYYSVLEGLRRQKEVLQEEKVVNFDIATKGAKNPGAVRFSRFYTLYVPREENGEIVYDEIDLNDDTRSPEKNLEDAEKYFFGQNVPREQRIAIINEILERNFDNNLKYLREVGIIKYRSGWRNLPKYNRYEPVAIDTAHLNAIITAYGNSLAVESNLSVRSIATCALLFDACIKHQIAMEEYQRLFVGNPGLFVTTFTDGHPNNDTGDISKRLGGHVSTGETQCRLDDVPTHYNQAELIDYKIGSSQKDELGEWFNESESRFVLYATKQKEISIKIQSVRQSLMNLGAVVRNQHMDSSYIADNFKESFKDIDDDHIDRFLELLEMASKAKGKEDYLFDINQIPVEVRKYKADIVKQEYTRQRELSLQQVQDELEALGLLTGVQTRVAAYGNNYAEGKINVADGASYVSPIMVKWMLQSIGKFNGKVAKAWNSLQNGDVRSALDNAIDYHTITDALFGTQKYTATGYRMNNGYPIFSYLKTALFPLFRQIAYGRTLDILNQMDKDNVHLLAFESAVKFGSQGKQHFPQTKEELASFKFNTYSMDFKWLRKQLNTDPKESELMAVGTQTKKIALTILDIYKDDYQKRNSEEVEDGLTLRNRIFESERQLANIGWKELMERFSSEVEMAKYIRDNLAERDADADTLEGLSLQEVGGTMRMVSPLEGLSNSEWIQSIITSLANKHIIDVNLPGSAFIQRSVYSMEGGSILGDNQIPSIPTLKISNDWSSMDAVVSIDYFYQQFPFLEKMGFNQAREWLINHNLIGDNAIADTVAYRIPTQANSSIHALRFVDVISTVRDTIILPSEFTAITGSDFDIDKLFLSSKYFNYDEETDTVTTTFEQDLNPKKFYGNQLMECYLELLTQPKNKYANQLVRSIDYDTEIPMKVVNLLKQGQVKKIDTYDALQLYRQCQIKSENRTGGIGVGPYALNNNNEIMSMLFEVESDNVGIIKALDVSRLYDKLDAEGDSVMATIGAFISGHVDIAKNPWVTILNINEYTYDIHIFLARTGMGLRALWFCAQPIMRKIADIYIQSGGYLFDSKDEGTWIRRKKAFDQFEKQYVINGNARYQKMIDRIRRYGNSRMEHNASRLRKEIQADVDAMLYAIQQIFGVDPQDPSKKVNEFKFSNGATGTGTILQDIALHHNEESDITDPTPRYMLSMPVRQENGFVKNEDVPVSVKDVQMYVYLANIMLDDPVSDMKKLVQLSKIETKKQGKNRAEQLAYDMNYKSFFRGGNTKIMLPDTVFDVSQESSINAKQRLFMDAMNNMLHNQILSYSVGFEDIIQQFLSFGSLGKNAKTIKSVINGLNGWLKYQFIRQYAMEHNINIRDLFIGNNSIYNELGRLRSKIIENPAVYDRYTDGNGRITNALIAKLQPSDIPGYVQEDYGDSLPKFVDFQINQSDNSAVSTDLKEGWRQMLTDTEHEDIQEFARRLVVYAFMTSGDTTTFGGFFNKVPMYWRNQASENMQGDTYISYIANLLDHFNNEEEALDEDSGRWIIADGMMNTDIFTQILKNNWFDNNLVPTIQETSIDMYNRSVNNYFEYTQNGKPILLALVKSWVDQNGMTHFTEATIDSPKAVIKVHKHDHDSYRNPQDFRLYEFVRMGTVLNENGDLISFPIYGRTTPTGGMMYGHTLIQYGDDLQFGWEQDTIEYGEDIDSKFREGMYQLYNWFDLQFDRNKKAISEGIVSAAELRENTVKELEDIPITAQFEDGTPIELTASNSYQFYNMAKMMGKYLMLHPTNRIEETYHSNSLSNIKKAKPVTEEQQQEEKKDIDVWSTNRDRYSNLSNVAVRPMEATAAISSVVSDNIINRIINKMGKNKFNCVEQLFQLIKFEMMRDHIREKAKEMYGLDRLQLKSSKDREALAINGILRDIAKKEERIMESSGSSITSISHQAIPDINNIVNSFWEEKWNQGGPENYANSTAYKVIREIMLQSFLQNPGATKLLLSTDGYNITHNKGSVYWKEAFPSALMSVRDEIKENYDNLVELENKGITMLGGNEFAYEEYSIPIKYAKEGRMFDDVAPFFTEEEAEQIKSSIPEGQRLTVASASRRTDPVFYASRIIDILRENAKKPFTDPTRINLIEIWSKHDGIPMQNILEACKKYRVAPMVSFSITGLGNTTVEPGVMKYNDLLDNIEKLVKVGVLDPRTTTVRVDPILPGVSSVDDLRKIIERAVAIGVRKFVTSPMQTYSTQKDRKGNSRSVIPHIDAALKADISSPIKYKEAVLPDGSYNWMKIYGLHPNQKINPGAIAFIPKKEYIKPYVDLFEEMMAKYDITIQSCAVAVGNLKPSACLDPEIIEAVTSLSVDAIEDKTRPFCHCYGAHSDLFRQTDECNSSCTYCYQGWAKVSPFDYYDENGKLKDFSYAKVNEYEEMEDGPVEVVIKDNKYTYNEGNVVDSEGNPVDEATKQRVIWKRAVDLGKAHLVNVNGIYYIATNTGFIFNWGAAKVEHFSQYDKLKEQILNNLQNSSYNKPNVSTLFNAQELKQLGESRKKFCKK